MKIPVSVEAALHCCVVLFWLEGERVSATALADWLNLPPEHTRKSLRRLSNVGIIDATRGNGGGLALADLDGGCTALAVVEALSGPVRVMTSRRIAHQGPGSVHTDRIGGRLDCQVLDSLRLPVQRLREDLVKITVRSLALALQYEGLVGRDDLPDRARQDLLRATHETHAVRGVADLA